MSIKLTPTLFLLVFPLFSHLGCARKTADYYCKLTINQEQEIIGNIPINEETCRSVRGYQFSYNRKGDLIRVSYMKKGVKAKDPYWGVAEVEIEHLSSDTEKRTYFDHQGNPSPDKTGVYAVRIQRDKKDKKISVFNYGKDGNLVEDNIGIAHLLTILKKGGKDARVLFFNRFGDRVPNWNGAYEQKISVDEIENTLQSSDYGIDGKLLKNDSISIKQSKRDPIGNQIELKYFNEEGTLKSDRKGVAVYRVKYNNYGNVIEERFYGIDDQLTENKSVSAAIARYKVDPFQNIIEMQAFDPKEKPKPGYLGYSTLQIKYNDQGKIFEYKCLDPDGRLIEDKVLGCATLQYKYDEQWNLIGAKCWDSKGRPKKDKSLKEIQSSSSYSNQ